MYLRGFYNPVNHNQVHRIQTSTLSKFIQLNFSITQTNLQGLCSRTLKNFVNTVQIEKRIRFDRKNLVEIFLNNIVNIYWFTNQISN